MIYIFFLLYSLVNFILYWDDIIHMRINKYSLLGYEIYVIPTISLILRYIPFLIVLLLV